MIKIENNIATREPIPDFLVGLAPESLVDLSWVDTSLGVHDMAWWPEEYIHQEFDAVTQRIGDEILTPDTGRKIVVVTRAIVDLSQDEIDAIRRARIPQRVPMRNARRVLIMEGLMPYVKAFLDAIPGVDGELARNDFEFALTIARDNPIVTMVIPNLGRTEDQIDAMFVAAAAME